MSHLVRVWGIKGVSVLFVMFAIGISAVLSVSSYGERINQLVLDSFTRWQLTDSAPREIAIVDIDERALQQIGPWPWPRALDAALLKVLYEDYQVKRVGLDMVFPEASSEPQDVLLAQTVGKTDVCLGISFDFNPEQHTRVGYLGGGHEPLKIAVEASGYIGNFLLLAKQGRCFGHISPKLDQDGLIRRVYTQVHWKDQGWFYLAAEMVGNLAHLDQVYTVVPYRIRPDAWLTVSASDVLMRKVSLQLLQGKFILVGSSALGLSDKVATPVHPWLPGMLVHAELLDGLLHPLPSPPPGLFIMPYAYGAMLTILLALLLSYQRLKEAIMVLASGLLVWAGVAYFLWESRQTFSVIFPFLSVIIGFLLISWLEWHSSLRQQKKIEQLFRGYVAPVVVDRVLTAPSPEEVVKPQKREVTVMFADISGFSELSKELAPDQLVKITRALLSVVTEKILQYEGTVDKYIGDAVMAFWNAPLEQDNHSKRALQCALDIQSAIAHWNQTQNPLSRPIQVHIALHCGEVVVGDVGTSFRHVYTVIGRVVNEAERLMHQGERPDRIVISPVMAQGLESLEQHDAILVGKL